MQADKITAKYKIRFRWIPLASHIQKTLLSSGVMVVVHEWNEREIKLKRSGNIQNGRY
jgi:hypothetical protein